MVRFTKIFWKNFLSTGNAGSTIEFDKHPTTLVQGASGSGKSTLIDALCFGLFGKPFRNINKPQLINSINQKNLEVQIWFDVEGKKYHIIRGMKPTRFEIICNGELINQDAASRDYQKVLEQQILMFSFRTFTQVVILGSTSYTPFMQLTAGARREVIEDILDIGVFSIMNTLLKEKIQETKDALSSLDSEIRVNKEKTLGLKKLITVLSENKNSEDAILAEKLQENQRLIDAIKQESAKIQENIQNKEKQIHDHESLINGKNRLSEALALLTDKIEGVDKDMVFFKDNSSCPTCEQDIGSSHKEHMITGLLKKHAELAAKETETKDLLTKFREKVENNNTIRAEITKLQMELNTNVARISELSKVVLKLTEDMVRRSDNTEIEKHTAEIKEVANKVIGMLKNKKMLSEEREIQEAAATLLRDTGIKTAIIREYLPIINRMVNKYLSEMELFVQFELDEQFNETIRSRHRDVFSYDSFSEGEKMRLDLSLLFSWRHITKLKNSANTNLLIMDEILAGRLDIANTDIVINLINKVAAEGTNVFIISHGDNLQDKFKGLLRFEKQNGYSVML